MNDWVNAEQYAERARTFFQNGEWEKALSELTRAIALNPEQGEWHFGLGLTLDALHRHELAIESYQNALRLRGDDPEIIMHIGIDLIHLGQHRDAIDWLARCNKIDPRLEPGYCFRVAAYTHLNDHEKAEEMFYLARQLQDECPACYDHLAHSLYNRGQIDKAIWCWQQTLRLAPEHDTVRASLGRAHRRRGQLERANVLFEQQLSHHPDDLDTRMRLGRLQMQMDRHADATRTFQSVIDLNPTIALTYAYLAELALKTGDLDETLTNCEMAVQLDPDIPGIHFHWAMAHIQRGRIEQARPLLLLEVDKPDHRPQLAIDISRTLIDLGMVHEAIGLLSRLIAEADMADMAAQAGPTKRQRDPQLATMLLDRSYAFLVSGRRRAGIADCRRALKLTPGNALAMHNLAFAYVEEGQLRRAAYFHRRAAALRTGDPMVRRLGHRIRRIRLAAWIKRLWLRVWPWWSAVAK